MAHIEKTVFIGYRRSDVYLALAVYKHLTESGFDVFFDFQSIVAGDFEQIILGNIRARAHFILILTPSALDRCNSPGDWLRREIETAIDEKRNIVPLFFNGFNFGSKTVTSKLTGKLANIRKYNGLEVPANFFNEAMQRLEEQYLNIALDAVLHPVSDEVQRVVMEQKRSVEEATSNLENKPLPNEFDKESVSAIDENITNQSNKRIQTEQEELFLNETSINGDLNVNIEGLALSDTYSQIDLLGYSDYVEALANFIQSHKTQKPITIGIDAAWGGGKTTLMRLLKNRLVPQIKNNRIKSGEHIYTVWFDAWKYDQQEILWAALVLEILDQVRIQFDWKQKLGLFIRLNKTRFDWVAFGLSIIKAVGIAVVLSLAAFSAFLILVSILETTWLETFEWLKTYSKVLAVLGLATLTYTMFKDLTALIVSPFGLGISQYIKKPNYKEKIGFISKFAEDYKCVISAVTKKGVWPLVVFIDDLDRCSPAKAAEVIEAMNLLLDSEHCVFILGMDTAMLSRSIQAKYKDIQPFFDDVDYPSRTGLGRHFLEKIVQIDFRIPHPNPL
ncbi:TIR domain-containing protein, partial [Patescibacteria group bacterium]|nr:TIR domain-containing protein [Patescibacteria group bacterium]